MAAQGGALRGAEHPPIDVLILVALEDELDAVLAEGGGAGAWREIDDHVHVSALPRSDGPPLGVAVAWTGAMGTTATATRAAPLIAQFRPSCLAMCGICAGKRGDVALGDVIVADRVYSFEHGKLVAGSGGGAPSFSHDIETYNLERSWRLSAAAFRRDLDWAQRLLASRPPTVQAQRRWLLRTLHAHAKGDGPSPLAHPERAAMFRSMIPGARDWADLIVALRREGLLDSELAALRLTDAGRLAVEDDYLLHPDGAPIDPAFQVHVGPIATGNAVIEDPEIFHRLKRVNRKTLGVEMEAFAIGYVGDPLPQRAIVAKAVSDFADHDKDDRFREFACRASAAWLFAFLTKHLAPRPAAVRARGSSPPGDRGPPSPFPDLPDLADLAEHSDRFDRGEIESPLRSTADESRWGLGELEQRVARALALRHPEVPAMWKQGPAAVAALRTFLEVREPRGRHAAIHVIAIVDGDVEAGVIDAFVEHIVKRYGAASIEPQLVYTGAVAAPAADRARKLEIRLVSLLELQGLLDFRPYVEHQMARLARDAVYPPGLFVPQRLAYRVGLDPFEADDALEALDAWLGHDGPQLMMILGDFGTGKTFLMHELARRLGQRHLEMRHAIVPVLVELRRLEKSRSLEVLLGQHFVPERGMRRFDHGAFQYMLEEGRVALLFDGFDELALRVTYAAATEHLDTVLQAATRNAKVMITSRTQHFLNDQQVLQALGTRVQQRGFRMMRLQPFDDGQIRRFLVNRFVDPAIAERRFELLGEVKDLLGLSQNPRMLGFIADIAEVELRGAAEGGEITSATLYRVLLGKWLGHEVERDHPPGIEPTASEAARWRAAHELAVLLWTRKERTIGVADIAPDLLDQVSRLSERPLSRDAAAFKIGSATLLCRDEDGRFSFIHQSVVEWLVASAAADDLRADRIPALLSQAEMTDLMADFLSSLAGRDRTRAWARAVLAAPTSELGVANANRVLRRIDRRPSGETLAISESEVDIEFETVISDIEVENLVSDADTTSLEVIAELPGHDLRGRDFSGTRHLRGAMLEGANLSDASLARADLSNAMLTRANLRRADLSGALLSFADLRGADLSFARLMGADLRGAQLMGTRLHYTALIGARIGPTGLWEADVHRIAPPHPSELGVVVGTPLSPGTSVAFSSDGALLAVGYQDGTVIVLDSTTGRVMRRFDGHTRQVTCVAFAAEDRALASSSRDHTVRLWSLDDGTLLHTFTGHTNIVTGVAIVGGLLASSSDDCTIRLWDPETGKPGRVLKGHSMEVTSVALARDRSVLASGSRDCTVRLWDPDSGKLLRVLEGHSLGVTSVALAQNGQVLASGSRDRTIRLWDSQQRSSLRVLAAEGGAVTSVAFSGDGAVLASAYSDGTVKAWTVGTGAMLGTLEAHRVAVTSVALSPDARILASASFEWAVRLWNADTGAALHTIDGHTCRVNSVAFSPDGRVLAAGSEDGRVALWQRDTGTRLPALKGHGVAVTGLAFSVEGGMLASASRDGTIRIWDPHTWRLLHAIGAHAREVTALAFSHDGRFLASSSEDRSILLWKTGTGTVARKLTGHFDWTLSIAFSPDDRLLASASEDRTVRLWSTAADLPPRVLTEHPAQVRCVAFSPDGRVLVSGAGDGAIRLWDPNTGELLRTLEGHGGCVRTVAFAHLGGLLASGSDDQTIRLWNPDTGELLRTLTGHRHGVVGIAFSPDWKTLASASLDDTVRLWNVDAALRGASGECLGTLVSGRRGWAAYTPDGRYKLGGETAGLIGFTVGLCRFEPGELDAYPDAFEHPPRRVGPDDPLFEPATGS